MALSENMVIPERMTLILNGNGRQTKKRGLPRTMGHEEGCAAAGRTVEITAKTGIRYLTVYGFSTEDWEHSKEEVEALIQLFGYYMVRLPKITIANNVRVRMIGDRTRLDSDIMRGINRLENQTKDNTGLTFVVTVNYGERDRIRRAATRLARNCVTGKTDASRVDEAVTASYLGITDMPDSDLLIRTSGELRLLNYLLWQLTRTEIVVTDCLWLDFDQKELEKAIVQYNKRDRRFGTVK